MEERKGAYSVLVGKAEGMRVLLPQRNRWKDNITINFKEMEWGVD
jgi:hypothetical protein